MKAGGVRRISREQAPDDLAHARQHTLAHDAEAVADHLHAIRRALRRATDEDRRQISLTPPQTHALYVLTQPEALAGLSLTELSARMGLAHSTVSGIVARLERLGLVCRSPSAEDRRITHIAVAEPVQAYVRQQLPARRLGQLIAALEQASDDERATVVAGVGILRRLLADSANTEDDLAEPNA
jgi:DNA-binding MarR family transcriptional regulator